MKKSRKTREKAERSAPTRLALSIAEVAERTGVSGYTLRRMTKAGTLRVVRFGRRILIPTRELENLLKPASVAGGNDGRR
jgi:excisionase family DNA binding protein